VPRLRLAAKGAAVLLAFTTLSCSERVQDADGEGRIHVGDKLFCGTLDYKAVGAYGQPGGRSVFSIPWGTLTAVEEITREGVWNRNRTTAGFLRCTVQHNGSPTRVWLYSENVYVPDEEGRVDALRCGEFERSLSVGDKIYAGRVMPNVPSNILLSEPHPRALHTSRVNVPSDTELVVEEVVNGYVRVTYKDDKGEHVGWLTAKHVARTRYYWFFQGTFIFLMIALLVGFNFFIIPGFLGAIFPPTKLVASTVHSVRDRLTAGMNWLAAWGGKFRS